MMSEAVRGLWKRPWLTLAGLALGVLIAPAISNSVAMLADLYYDLAPITRLSGTVVRADAREVVVHLIATKRRAPGCNFLQLRANTVDARDERERAVIERIDMQATGEGLPPGVHDIGTWRIVPRSDGVAVIVSPMYECSGQIVWGGAVVLALPPVPAIAGEGGAP